MTVHQLLPVPGFINLSESFNLTVILQLSVALTFIGHGIVALTGEPKWYPYIKATGFSTKYAPILLRLIGLVDVAVGLAQLFCFNTVSILLNNSKLALSADCNDYCYLFYVWAAVWGFSTALLRPLSGESIWGFIERGGNYLPAIGLLLLDSKSAAVQLQQQLFNYYIYCCIVLFISGFIFCAILRITGIFGDDNRKSTVTAINKSK